MKNNNVFFPLIFYFFPQHQRDYPHKAPRQVQQFLFASQQQKARLSRSVTAWRGKSSFTYTTYKYKSNNAYVCAPVKPFFDINSVREICRVITEIPPRAMGWLVLESEEGKKTRQQQQQKKALLTLYICATRGI